MPKLIEVSIDDFRPLKLLYDSRKPREIVGGKSIIVPEQNDIIALSEVDGPVPACRDRQKGLGTLVSNAIIVKAAHVFADWILRPVIKYYEFPRGA